MSKLRRRHTWVLAFAAALALAASGCASKKYVSQQIHPVNQRVDQLQKQTQDQITYLNNKQQRDISQVNERIATTDQKVTQLAGAVQQAQGTASRAMEASDANSTKIEATNNAVSTLAAGVANSL